MAEGTSRGWTCLQSSCIRVQTWASDSSTESVAKLHLQYRAAGSARRLFLAAEQALPSIRRIIPEHKPHDKVLKHHHYVGSWLKDWQHQHSVASSAAYLRGFHPELMIEDELEHLHVQPTTGSHSIAT